MIKQVVFTFFVAAIMLVTSALVLDSSPSALAKGRAPKGGRVEQIKPGDTSLDGGISGVGAVIGFALPPKWKCVSHTERAYGYQYTWRKVGADEAAVRLSWDGHKLSEEEAAAVRSVLAKPPHKLSAQETSLVGSLLEHRASPRSFAISAVQTMTVDGTQVLSVTGKDLRSNQMEDTIFIDSGLKGQIFQKLTYSAPPGPYKTYLKEFRQVIATLRLKKPQR